MAEHEGHRERMRKKFDTDMNGMTDAELLELLLYYSIPRRDVRPVAEEVLEKLDGLAGLSGTDREELLKIDGVGESTAGLLELTAETARRAAAERRSGAVISGPEDALKQLAPRFRFIEGDMAFALFLDERMRVIACSPVDITAEDIAWQAVGFGSKDVVIGISYEDGHCTPDAAEARNVRIVRDGLLALEITILDYIIVGRSGYTSLFIDRLLRADESMRERYRRERDSSRTSSWAEHFTVHELPAGFSN